MNSVDAPQFALVRALVEERKTNIDTFSQYIYPDYAIYNQKFYLDREPGLSFIALPFYILAKIFSPHALSPYNGKHQGITSESPLEALTYGFTSSLVSLGIVFFFLILQELKYSKMSSFLSAIILATGTLIWKYSGGFVRQPVVLSLFFLIFYLFLKIKKKPTFELYGLAGLGIGVLFITDHLSIFTFPIFLSIFGYTFLKNRSSLTSSIIFLLGALIPLSLFFVYNTISFGNPFTTPRKYTALKGLQNTNNIFIADLRSTIPINLFSNGPIPQETFQYFKNHPELESLFSSSNNWASVWPYKGVFIQSPILLLSILGFLLSRKKKLACLFLLLFLAYFLPASKILVFYGPTAYDTRYTLPSIGFLFLGLPSLFDYFKKRNSLIKSVGLLMIILLWGISSYQALLSTSRHFAPHVTGEHRFDYSQSPLFSSDNLRIILINAFPNVYNLPFLLIYFILIFSSFYGVKLCWNYLIKIIKAP